MSENNKNEVKKTKESEVAKIIVGIVRQSEAEKLNTNDLYEMVKEYMQKNNLIKEEDLQIYSGNTTKLKKTIQNVFSHTRKDVLESIEAVKEEDGWIIEGGLYDQAQIAYVISRLEDLSTVRKGYDIQDTWGNFLKGKTNGNSNIHKLQKDGELEDLYKIFEYNILRKILLEKLEPRYFSNTKEYMESVGLQVEGLENGEIVKEIYAKGEDYMLNFVKDLNYSIENSLMTEGQRRDRDVKNISEKVEVSAYSKDWFKEEERKIVGDFFKKYGEDSKNKIAKEKLIEIRQYWGEGTEENKNKSFKEIVSGAFNSQDELFPETLNLNNKSQIEEAGFDFEEFKEFKYLMIRRKVETLMTKKEELTTIELSSIVDEIEILNEIDGKDRNILDYMYEIKYKELDIIENLNVDKELATLYTLAMGEGSDLDPRGTKKEMNNQINYYFASNPDKYKEIDIKFRSKLIVEEYIINNTIKENNNMFEGKKLEVLAAIKFLDRKMLKELDMSKEDMDTINKSAAEDKEYGLDVLEYYMIKRKRESFNNINFKELMTDKKAFDEKYEEYIIVNNAMAKNNEKKNQRSFFLELAKSVNKDAAIEDSAIKALAFINKNFKDVLNDEKYNELVNKVKSSDFDKNGYDLSFIADLEKEIFEKYDNMRREGKLVEMANLNFVEMSEYNKELMSKDSMEIFKDFENVKLDKIHFVIEVFEMFKNEEDFFEKTNIQDKKLQEEFKNYCKKYKEGTVEESKVDDFLDNFLYIKAEDENRRAFSEITENFDEMGPEKKNQILMNASKKYSLIRKVKGKANIVEDYLRGVEGEKKRDAIKSLLVGISVVGDELSAAMANIDVNKKDGEYNETLTRIIEEKCQTEEEMGKLINHLSTHQNTELYQPKPVKRYTIAQLNSQYSKDLTQEIQEMKEVEIENERLYNVRGLSIIQNDGLTFQMGYNIILQKYNSGEFKGNQDMEELIGLRLAMGQISDNFGDMNIDGISIKPMIDEDDFIEKLMQDEQINNELVEYINRDSQEGERKELADIEEGRRKEIYRKIMTSEINSQRYKEIVAKIYVEKKDKFLSENSSHLIEVEEQRRLKHSLRELNKNEGKEKIKSTIKEKIATAENKIKEENVQEVEVENKKENNELREIIEKIISSELTEGEKLQIQEELENMQIRSNNMTEENESTETEENKTKERIKELVGDKIDKVKIEELMQAYKNKRKYEKTSDKEKSNSKTI